MDSTEGISSIEKSAGLNLPLSLPWDRSLPKLQPGTTFHSRLSTSADPWSKESPFHQEKLKEISVQYRNDDGGIATYNSTESMSSTSSSEHLSVSFGITVGCKWLNASVTGGYDKDTLDNNDCTHGTPYPTLVLHTQY